MNQFLLDVITPQRKAFSEQVDSVSVPTPDGTIEVLAKHEPLFTQLAEGEVKITAKGKEFYLAIGGGFMEVRPKGEVTILVSRAVHADEINESEIKKAMDSAKDLIARKAKGEELAAAIAVLHRTMLELKVSKRKHKASPFRTQ
ncbi:MAG: ATP synthase F1 subunit epsilon [Patescibacteria group bacterium]